MTPTVFPNPPAAATDAALAFASVVFALGCLVGLVWLGYALAHRPAEPDQPRVITLDREIVLPDVHRHRARRRLSARTR